MKPTASLVAHARTILILAIGVLMVVAVGARVAHIRDIRTTETFTSPLVDAYIYDRSARQIVQEGPQTLSVPYYQPPGYPFLLAAVYAVSGGDFVAPRILNALLGIATTLLVFVLGRRLGGDFAGWLAGILFATYGPVLYYEGQLLPPPLLLFLSTAALVLVLTAESSASPGRRLAVAGFLLGFATVTRPTGLLLTGGIAFWLLHSGRRSDLPPEKARSRRRPIAIFVTTFLLALLPATVANVVGGHQPVLVSWNGGINFYLGNGAGSDSLTTIQPGAAWDRLQREPLLAGARGGSAQSRYWLRRTANEIARDPGEWALALGRKAIRLLDARETPRNTDYDAFRPSSLVLSLPVPGFTLLAPLALLGILTPGLPRRARTLLLLALGAVAVENLLFFVTSRYRLEAVPVLCVLAGCGVAAVVRQGRRGPNWRAVAWVIPFTILVAADMLGEREIDHARVALNRGVAHRRAGRDAGAARAFREALRHAPGDPDAHRWLGEMALGEMKRARSDSARAGKAREAIAHFDRSLVVAPDYIHVLLGKAQALEESGQGEKVEAVYRSAVATDPFSAGVRLNYGVFLAIAGREAEARRQFAEGLRLTPDDPRFRANLDRLERGL